MSDRNKNNRQSNTKNRAKSAQTEHTSQTKTKHTGRQSSTQSKTQRTGRQNGTQTKTQHTEHYSGSHTKASGTYNKSTGKNPAQPQSPEARRRALRRARQEAKRRARNSLIVIIGLAGVIIIAVVAGVIKSNSASKDNKDATTQTETTSNSTNNTVDTSNTDTEAESVDESDTETNAESESESQDESDTSESESADESGDAESTAADNAASGVASGSTQGIVIKMNEETLKKNVTALVRQYRAALAAGDTETLATLFHTDTLKSPGTYTGMAEVITGYQNTECCIMDGMDDTSKIVFIYDDLTIAGIDVTVPNVTAICVRMSASGQLYIDPGTYDEDSFSYKYDDATLAYINNLKGVGDAADMVRKANEKFEEACNTDPQLKHFISDMIDATDN